MTSRLRLHNVRVPCGAPEQAVRRAAAAKLKLETCAFDEFRIVRRSVDTRARPRIYWSLAVEFDGEPELIASLPPNEASLVEPAVQAPISKGTGPLSERPLVVGAGPAGLFAALVLAENGYAPLVVDRGKPVRKRNLDVGSLLKDGRVDPDSNLLFGLGGAGTYSDGKLTTGTSDPRLGKVVETFHACGAPDDILVDARPHIGSDLLPEVVTSLRRRVESLGGEFVFGFKVDRLEIDGAGRVGGVSSSDGGSLRAAVVVLAAGMWDEALVERLAGQGVLIETKPFQIGVRIEHPQSVIDRAVYARERGDLPAAEYILSCRPSGGARGVASFCMCPGGVIVPAVSRPGRLSTNGMSGSARDGEFANAALIVTVDSSEVPEGRLGGLEFQARLEEAAFAVAGDLIAPAQTASDFLSRRRSAELPECSYPLGVAPADLRSILPGFLVSSLDAALPRFDRKMPGFVQNGLLVGVEARVSSAVRVVRDRESRESVSMAGLYPVGEGSGYAGGIMTSAVDGMRTAEAIIGRYAPPNA